MFYCKYCSNTLEIIKNNNISKEETVNVINTVSDLVLIVIEDIEAKKNRYINTDIKYSINWNKSEIDTIKKEVSLPENITIKEFMVLISNKYDEIIKTQKSTSLFYLSCTNCGTNFYLEPGIILDSTNYEKVDINIEYDNKIKCQDHLLPRTKDFICPNKKCINNTNSNDESVLIEKEAVFFRLTKEYNIKYICCQCYVQWGT
jgi:hypothetical protein